MPAIESFSLGFSHVAVLPEDARKTVKRRPPRALAGYGKVLPLEAAMDCKSTLNDAQLTVDSIWI
jgi:hypothetical protein